MKKRKNKGIQAAKAKKKGEKRTRQREKRKGEKVLELKVKQARRLVKKFKIFGIG